jgi:hypothetical protein
MSDSCDSTPDIPIGVPFAGGSDDPSELVGINAEEMGDGTKSEEGGDPGV